MNDWLSAEEAMEKLGVRQQTLYAYVSRGRVQAQADPHDPRRSRYRASDVATLTARKSRGRKVAEVAQSAIAWGEPVLASSITTVANGRLYYRGRDAVTLSQTETFEAVARLLRGGHGAALKRADRPEAPPGATMRARAFAALAIRAGVDPPARGRAPLSLAVEAATLLDVLTDAVAGGKPDSSEIPGNWAIHQRLAQAWGCGPQAADTLRRALILLADHELNASTFAARVAASTGASLAASALAGLSALSGPLHGGMASRVRSLVEESMRRGARLAITERLAQGQGQATAGIPGFGHPLYAEGDVRAAALLTRFEVPAHFVELRQVAEAESGDAANVDFALTAMAEALTLPEDAPFILFAVARCAGWIAHAIEQGATGALIRPRARYEGPEPEI